MFKSIKHVASVTLLLLAIILSLSTVPTASAQTTIIVSGNTDIVADDGVCTLPEAINAANSDTASGVTAGECPAGSGSDTIDLNANTVLLTAALPEITTDTTLRNGGIQRDATAEQDFRLLTVRNASVTMADLSLSQGRAASGGGVLNDAGDLTIVDSSFTKNKATSSGGAVFNAAGSLTITNSSFSSNNASSSGGAIASEGASAQLSMTGSSLSNNSAGSSGGAMAFLSGQGTLIGNTWSNNTSVGLVGGLLNVGAGVSLANVTASGNSGAGIANIMGNMSLNNVTVAANDIGLSNFGVMTLRNSLIADNTTDCQGAFISQGFNLIQSAGCNLTGDLTGNITGQAAALAALADNGGGTQTHAIGGNSPARDAGDLALCETNDQRGTPRPQSATCDIGAYELTIPTTSITRPDVVTVDPADSETDIALTRETIIKFPQPINASDVTSDAFSASFAGIPLSARVQLSFDRDTVTLFYDDPLPFDSRIQVTINGDLIRYDDGTLVDVDGDGTPGGTLTTSFVTLTLNVIAGTEVCGRVFASEVVNNGYTDANVPLENVTITVDGAEAEFFTTTDNTGYYCLSPAPAGRFFVHIEGGTVTNNTDGGGYYPSVGKVWQSVAGQSITKPDTFLPYVPPGTLQPVSDVQDTVITMSAFAQSTNPELASIALTVPANSLYANDGTRGGQIGIAPVPSDRLPGPLPEGLTHAFDITVQSDGPTNFDEPAPICFPNLPDPDTGEPLPPGETAALMSFNHDSGNWEFVGPMTISADGVQLCTDPGVGIQAPGWHGADRGSGGGGGGGYYPPGNPSFGVPPGSPAFPPDRDPVDDPFDDPEEEEPECEQAPPALNECVDQLVDFVSQQANCAYEAAKVLAGLSPLTAGLDATLSIVDGLNKAANGDLSLLQDLAGKANGLLGKLNALQSTLNTIKACQDALNARDQAEQCFEDFNAGCGDGGSSVQTLASVSFDPYAPTSFNADDVRNNLLDEGELLIDAAISYQTVYYGNEKWFEIGGPGNEATFESDAAARAAIFEALTRYVESGSRSGNEIDADERADLSALPLPSNITPADLNTTIDHLNAISAGTLPQVDQNALAAATQHLLDVLMLLQNREWENVDDILLRSSERIENTQNQIANPIPHYYRLENTLTGRVTRGQLSGQGVFGGPNGTAFLGANTAYVVDYYEPSTQTVSVATFFSAGVGETTTIPVGFAIEDTSPDSDNDGLSDRAEDIIGSRSDVADSDGDGIADGAEIEQGGDIGTNTGLLGVVYQRDTPPLVGAEQLCAVGNTLFVLVPNDDTLVLLNIAAGQTPAVVGSVTFPQATTGLTCDEQAVLLSDGAGRLYVVPTEPALNPTFVTIDATSQFFDTFLYQDYAFVRNSRGDAVMVDLADGIVLDQRDIDFGQLIGAADGFLYFWDDGINALPFSSQGFGDQIGDNSGSNTVSLTLADRIVWASDDNTISTYDLNTPGQGTLLATANGATDLNYGDLTLNGSGLGLIVADIEPGSATNNELFLYQLDDPANLDLSTALATFQTEGLRNAPDVWIHDGVAYVADNFDGLSVLNYRLPETGTTAPTNVTLRTDAPFDPPTNVIEGTRLQLVGNADDDVQVARIEFYANGERIATDRSYPFDTDVRVPEFGTTFTLFARAIDTAGNSSDSAPLVINPLEDTQAPDVTLLSPLDGESFDSAAQLVPIQLTASDNVDVDTIDVLYNGVAAADVARVDLQTYIASPPSTDGVYALVIRVTDVNGLSTETAPININWGDFGLARNFSGEIVAEDDTVDHYLFAASPQSIILELTSGDPNDFGWRVYAPNDNDDEIFSNSRASLAQVALEVPGLYRIEMFESVFNTPFPVPYTFSVIDVPAPTPATLTIGETVDGEIMSLGDEVHYSFSVTPTALIVFDWLTVGNARWRLVAPDGSEVFNFSRSDEQTTLDQVGNYTLIVDGSNVDSVGAYQFRTLVAPPPDVSAINFGDTVNGDLEAIGAEDHYTFSGTVDDDVLFIWLDNGQRWTLEAPSGDRPFTNTSLDRQEVLEETGTYTLFVDGDTVTTTGTYSFTVVLAAPADVSSFTLGDTVDGEIAAVGETDVYTFEANAGDTVEFALTLGDRFDFDWSLTSPDGFFIFTRRTTGTIQRTLSTAGTYTLIVYHDDITGTGTYQFTTALIP